MYTKLGAFTTTFKLSRKGTWDEAKSFHRVQREPELKARMRNFQSVSTGRNVRTSLEAIVSKIPTTKEAKSLLTDDEKMLANYVPVYVMLPVN